MIFLSKIITAFILPPGCIIAVLILLIFFVPRKIKYYLGIVTFFLYLLSIQPVSDLLLKPLENAYPPFLSDINEYEFDSIVVLGGGTIMGSPEAVKQDTLSADAMKRAVYGFILSNKYPVPVIFSGGKVFEYNQEPEAVVAGYLYEALGLPSLRFIAETESRNTWENAKETAKLEIPELTEIKKIVLVTSAYHMKRSVYCFESNGISVIPAPTDYKCYRGQKYDLLSFIPLMTYLRNSQLALHEYIGLLYYPIVYR
jgi:uncharacterized SAM-binding protein YcdF (DUF218 family)